MRVLRFNENVDTSDDITDRIEKLIDDIAKEVHYDVWKEAYNERTAECSPREVNNNRQRLRDMINKFLQN